MNLETAPLSVHFPTLCSALFTDFSCCLCLVIALIYICALFSYLTVYITCETASWLSLFFIEQNQIYNSIHYWAETQSLKDELEIS